MTGTRVTLSREEALVLGDWWSKRADELAADNVASPERDREVERFRSRAAYLFAKGYAVEAR